MKKLASVRISSTEKISLISNMATMLSAGIPILEVVNSLAEDAKGGVKIVLETLRQDLMQGNHVYQTFNKFPYCFDKVTVNVLKAAEEAGTLDITLKDLKTNIQKEVEFMDKVRFALMYPVFIFIVFIGVLLMMLTVVIPKIATVFERLKVELPLPTRILIFVSNLLMHQTLYLAMGLGLFIFVTYLLFYYQRARMIGILLSLPVVTNLAKEIDLTRFSRSLYLLLFSGLPITGALELTVEMVSKKQTAKVISTSRDLVSSGKTLSEGLRAAKGYIPAIMIRLIEAGEKTGTLEKTMQDLAEYFDYQVSKSLKTLTTLLEPIMLVFVGVVVGGMMLAIIAPIYSLVGSVGAR